LRILIIEDSVVQRSFYESFLEKNSHETKYVVTAEDGLDILEEFKPELIILDYFLPGMNAPDFLTTLEKNNLMIPVIVATASDKKEDKSFCIIQGAMTFLQKPFDEKTLLDEIDKAIDNFEIKNLLKPLSFNDIDLDFLAEIGNIGMGVGANKLGKMMDLVVKLQSPKVKILPMKDIQNLPYFKSDKISALQIKFSGDLSGHSFLLMSEKESDSLYSFIFGKDSDSEIKRSDLIGEMGNIILNSLIGTISNKFKIRISPKVPQYFCDSPQNIIGNLFSPKLNGSNSSIFPQNSI
jgi:chemotaxis protein CheC